MERQNVTLSLPKDLLINARHMAIDKGTSLSGLLSEFIRLMVEQDRKRQQAQLRMEARLQEGFDLGTGGQTSWPRDELHER